jgi:DNA-binding transcriptional ArsR family regulator
MNLLDRRMSIETSILPGAAQAAALLRAMGHSPRLEILCLLQEGEMGMSEIARRLSMKGPAASQQLAVLRGEGLITCRRRGRAMLYSLGDDITRAIIEILRQRFCPHGP